MAKYAAMQEISHREPRFIYLEDGKVCSRRRSHPCTLNLKTMAVNFKTRLLFTYKLEIVYYTYGVLVYFI